MMVILFVCFVSGAPFTLVLWFDFWFCVAARLQQTGLLMMSFVSWHTDLTNSLHLFCVSRMGEVD